MAEGGFGYEANDLSPEFREYTERELYDSSRLETGECFCKDGGWLFWDQRDDHPHLTLSNDHYVDFDPHLCPNSRVRLKIRGALRKLIVKKRLEDCLIQFWAPTKTLEGRTYLTVKNQPFGFGLCLPRSSREALCQYRMGIRNLRFNPYAKCVKERLGFPAHVFIHKLPEYAQLGSYYFPEEYPPGGLALHRKVRTFLALPMFDNSSHTCVGVIEIVSYFPLGHLSSHYDGFFHCMGEIFQEFGLSCLDENKHRIMQLEDKNGARIAAFKELEVACKSLYEITELFFALAWVSRCPCSDLLQCLFKLPYRYCTPPLKVVDFFCIRNVYTGYKLPISGLFHCSDNNRLTGFGTLLGPLASSNGVSGCFTMCLRSSNAAELYMVQFFLSEHINNHQNKLTRFRRIMDTMKGYFRTFRLAYGQEWGEELPLEVIDVQEDRAIHSIQKIPATRCTPGLELLKDEPLTLQLGLPYQPSVDPIDICMHIVGESQNSNSPSLGSLLDGIEGMEVDASNQNGHSVESVCISSQLRQPSVESVNNGMYAFREAQNSYTLSYPDLDSLPNRIAMMQLDSSDQKGHSVESIPAIGCIPSQWHQPSVKSVNIGMYAFNEAQNPYAFSDPSLDSSQNGIVMMQLDSSDQASVDPSNIFEDQEQSVELNSGDRTSAAGAFTTETIMAKFENCAHVVRFSLSWPPRLVQLQGKVAERKPKAGACDVFSIDKENGSILIGCDDELQQWIKKSRSLGNTSTRVFLRPKQPIPT